MSLVRLIIKCCPRNIYEVSNHQRSGKRLHNNLKITWNMPHIIGSIDRKHVRIKHPKNTGNLYHNYKGLFSLVLAMCHANYCFTLFDVGQYDSNNDSGVLIYSNMGEYFQDHSNIPQPVS